MHSLVLVLSSVLALIQSFFSNCLFQNFQGQLKRFGVLLCKKYTDCSQMTLQRINSLKVITAQVRDKNAEEILSSFFSCLRMHCFFLQELLTYQHLTFKQHQLNVCFKTTALMTIKIASSTTHLIKTSHPTPERDSFLHNLCRVSSKH